MLGRQQIAGVPTAISELFKNAYDAYADSVELDYFAEEDLVVLRDDGIGMTFEELESRWLVVGTENKLEYREKERHTIPVGKMPRAVMGEKGIGRLAIALLGRQVLVITRAIRGTELQDAAMAFVHWGPFTMPGLNLDEIEIPVHWVPKGRLPSAKDVQVLVDEFRIELKKLVLLHENLSFSSILDDLDRFSVDPENLDDFLEGISLRDSGHGTQFFIAPASEIFRDEITADYRTRGKDFSKFLLGFSNSVFAESEKPPIKTALKYWENNNGFRDVINADEFFTADDLNAADHVVRGRFDEYGQFRGDVRVYGKTFSDHVVPWEGAQGIPTDCGPFSIEFGYLQGAQRESQMPAEEWAKLAAKLDLIGGIYVYRDRIRVLPYGNSDVDWLDIELRRNKGSGYYFFSYRRVFGAVVLTREENSLLEEKAGREGFQRNKAYRQLTEILRNFFVQLAADFFRESSSNVEFQTRKDELERLELARRKREKQVTTKRKNLSAELRDYFQRVESGEARAKVEELRSSVDQKLESASKISDPDRASFALLEAERDVAARLTDLRESYRLVRPRGVALSRALQDDWTAYEEEQERMENEVFIPFSLQIAESLGKVATQAKLYVDQRKRLELLIRQVSDTKRKEIRAEAAETGKVADKTHDQIMEIARKSILDLHAAITEVESDLARREMSTMAANEIEQMRTGFESRIEFVSDSNMKSLEKIRDVLTSLSEGMMEPDGVDTTDIVESLSRDLESLNEQSDADAELIQLGLAVAIINHEFAAAITGIRSTLRHLKSWATANDDLLPIYQGIRDNFEHLDAHLSLFTPLQRRLYRAPVLISGVEIYNYVQTLFEGRLKRHAITLTATTSFRDATLKSFPSTIYPAFVNLVDNAIFWLRDTNQSRSIVFDWDGQSFSICNSGARIRKGDSEAIFEQGFTRKPGGRGLGLFISKRALAKDGLSIDLSPGSGPTCFRIRQARTES
jgi:hypothetical protein